MMKLFESKFVYLMGLKYCLWTKKLGKKATTGISDIRAAI